MKPPFTRKDLAAASTKRPIDWWRVEKLPLRYNVALKNILTGSAEREARVDIATLWNFILSAKELNIIDDSSLTLDFTEQFAAAYTRFSQGKSFRLDAQTAEAVKEMIVAFELIAKSESARDYMKICNHIPKNLQVKNDTI